MDPQPARATFDLSRLAVILDVLAEAVTIRGPDEHLIYANQAALDLLGFDTIEDVRAADPRALMASYEAVGEDGRRIELDELPSVRLLRGEQPEPLLMRSVDRTTGEERWVLLKTTAVHDADGTIDAAVTIIEDVTNAKRTQIRMEFLARASEVLASSLDYRQTLLNVAKLAVPQIADWCGVDLFDEESASEPVAHADPEPALTVPMIVQGRTIGALTLVNADSGRSFSRSDVEFAEHVAERAARAVENAQLYSERSEIANTLQHSLLPDALPTIPGWELAAFYRPAGHGNEVGGDFYDIWPTGNDWLLMVGDVTGKGVGAAAVTSLVRHSAWTASDFDARPGEILRRVDGILKRRPSLSICTALCVRISGASATIAVGGHPLPLCLSADGVREVGHNGPLLGALDGAQWTQAPFEMAPGETLVAITDGVTDTVGDNGERFGDQRLRELLAEMSTTQPVTIRDRLVGALEDFQVGLQSDDTAIVVLRFVGPATEDQSILDDEGHRPTMREDN